MKTHTFYREANVTKTQALTDLMKRFPTADVIRFVEKRASSSEAKAAGVKPGSKVFEARIRVAEFPPAEDSGESEESESSEESAEPKAESKPEPKEEGSEEGSESSESEDSAPSFDSPGEGGGDDLGGEPKELSHDEKVEHLLEQILDAVKGGGLGGPKDDPLGGGPDAGAGLDLPDIGAPVEGEPLPPPGGPGAGPGGPGGAPLPPPAKPKGVGAPAAFAKINPQAQTVTLVREDVTKNVTTSSIKAEAEELFPTHRVAKIRRRGQEVINGSKVSLPEANLAVVTLVKK